MSKEFGHLAGARVRERMMALAVPATWTLQQIAEGQECVFEVDIADTDLDCFGRLSGDVNPLHMNDQFARSRGFGRRVVHGAFLAALVSRLAGMHIPGLNCLIHELRLKFHSPAYSGDRLVVRGIVDQRSEAAGAIVMRVEIAVSSRGLVASGKVTAGFTTGAA
jgi:acyl dehydratase